MLQLDTGTGIISENMVQSQVTIHNSSYLEAGHRRRRVLSHATVIGSFLGEETHTDRYTRLGFVKSIAAKCTEYSKVVFDTCI